MVIFAATALVAPYLKGWWKVLPWALAAAVCLSRMYLGAHFPLDVIAGAGLGMFIGGVLNLVLGVPRLPSIPQTPAETRPLPTTPQGNRPWRASRRDDLRAASNNAHSRMICAR